MKGIIQVIYKIICLLSFGMLIQGNSQDANTINNMNSEVDPCHDFYSFACGGYRRFGANETRSVYDDSWNSLQTQIKNLLERLEPEEGSSSEKLKIVYENCMDVQYSEMKAVLDALCFLNRAGIPNWPKLNKDFRFQNLSRTLGQLAAHDEFAFVSFKPSPYFIELNDSYLRRPALILQGNFLLNSKWVPNDVHNAVLRILNYFNITKDEKDIIWQEFKEIENAGIHLQNESGNVLKCKSTPKDTFREVNCSENTSGSMKFLCNLWRSAVAAGNLDRYYSKDIFHISCSWNHFHYIDNVFSYLYGISDRSLANYLSLRFFISHLDDLNSYFHKTKKTFPGDKRSRTSESISRWEYCVGYIAKTMNSALGYEYTQKILTEKVQSSVLDIINDYIQELSNSIQNLNWLEERIKFYLQKQLSNLDIGFRKTVNNYRNKTLVESSYKMFSPEKGSFLRNILDYQKMSLLIKEKPLFNSFYSSSDPYTMDFGMALLQPPTFAYVFPKLRNYAALGFVIGHELSHNFKFFFDFVHLDEAVEKHLSDRLQCFIQQYSEFVVKRTGKGITSSEVKEEIIADNLGWELTQKIIEKMVAHNSTEGLKVPGLDFTPLQLAYISFAQDSCSVMSKDVEAEFYATKQQNLPNLRVNGVLQNSKTFSEAFNCAKGDAMNPENKCRFF